MTREPQWIGVEDALWFHAEVIRLFGGADGVRDRALLESAMGRPRHVLAYESQDPVVLAGCCAHAIVRNHPFVDGNKRVAFVVTRVFLGLNGIAFDPPEAEAVVVVEGLASGDVSEADYVAWVRRHAAG